MVILCYPRPFQNSNNNFPEVKSSENGNACRCVTHIGRPREAPSVSWSRCPDLTVSPDVAFHDFGICDLSATDAGEKRLQSESHAHLEKQRSAHGDDKSLLHFTAAGMCKGDVALKKHSLNSQPGVLRSPASTLSRLAPLPLQRGCCRLAGEENLHRVEVTSDIVPFTVRRELCRRPASYLRGLNKFCPVTWKYLA